MKALLTLCIFLQAMRGFSQVAMLKGQIHDSTQYNIVSGAQIQFIKNDTTIASNYTGWFQIKLTKHLNDTIVVSHSTLGISKIAISLQNKEVKEIHIHLPKSCKSIITSKTCPKCKSTKDVISILYGLPTKTGRQKADNGEVWLGGCVVDDCSPQHYCKKDKLEF